MIESDLYLRYVLGEVRPESLHRYPERHIACNPGLAQYIVDPGFPAVICDGAFGKQGMDPDFVAREEERVTRGWRWLQQLPHSKLTILDYPLPEIRGRWDKEADQGATLS